MEWSIAIDNITSETNPWQTPTMWYIAQTITCVNIFVELYILVALFTYGVREKKLCAPWNRPTTRLLLIGISMPMLHLFRIAFTQLQLFGRYKNTTATGLNFSYNTTALNDTCTTLNGLNRTTFAIALLHTYVFMWYRHRTVYHEFILSTLKKNLMKSLSYANISFILVSSVALVITTTMFSHYILKPSGCVLDPSIGNNKYTAVVLSFVLFFTALVMIFGLIMLLATHRIIQNRTNVIIRRMVKTMMFCLLFSVFFNLTIMLVALFAFPKSWPRYFILVLLDFSLVIDSVTIVFSYLDRWKILFGCFFGRKKTKQPSATTAYLVSEVQYNK